MSTDCWFNLELVESIWRTGGTWQYSISGKTYTVAFDKRDAFLEALGILEWKKDEAQA